MRPNKVKKAASVSVCRTQVFAGFSGYGNLIHNIIPLLKKENVQHWFGHRLIVSGFTMYH